MTAHPWLLGGLAGVTIAISLVEALHAFSSSIRTKRVGGSRIARSAFSPQGIPGGPGASDALGLRLIEAGLSGAIEPRQLKALRWPSSLGALLFGLLVGIDHRDGAGRLLLAAAFLAGWLAPDLEVRRRALRARKATVDALPAVFGSTARALGAGLIGTEALAASVRHRRDPFSRCVQAALLRISRGESPSAALARVAVHCPDARVSAFVETIDRSCRQGTSAADPVRAIAASVAAENLSLRAARAARAAPLIQLVVALMLVPSVLLVIGAFVVARVAH